MKPPGCVCRWWNLCSRPECNAHCTCWYDDDGGPYGVPHIDTDPFCPFHGTKVKQ